MDKWMRDLMRDSSSTLTMWHCILVQSKLNLIDCILRVSLHERLMKEVPKKSLILTKSHEILHQQNLFLWFIRGKSLDEILHSFVSITGSWKGFETSRSGINALNPLEGKYPWKAFKIRQCVSIPFPFALCSSPSASRLKIDCCNMHFPFNHFIVHVLEQITIHLSCERTLLLPQILLLHCFTPEEGEHNLIPFPFLVYGD